MKRALLSVRSVLSAAAATGMLLLAHGSVLGGWTTVQSGPYDAFFNDVWGSAASDIFALDAYGSVYHYDGSSWTEQTLPISSSVVAGIWGSSSADVFAVGYNGIILHYNGTSWSSMTSNTTKSLEAVWGSSATDVFAAGYDGTIMHYNGTSWSAMTSNTAKGLFGIWGSSASDVYAVGYEGTILHYNGSAWSSMSSVTTNTLIDIWGTSASDVYAVGIRGTIMHYNGTSWSYMTSNTFVELHGIWGSSSSQITAVGLDGTIAAYDGSTWTVSWPSTIFADVWGSSTTDLYMLSWGSYFYEYDGTNWSPVNTYHTSNSAIWGTSATDVFILGFKGDEVLHYDGTVWLSMTTGTTVHLNNLFGTSSSDIVAVGGWSMPANTGIILHYNGSSWSTMKSGLAAALNDVWGSAAGDYYAVGEQGSIMHYNGTSWSAMSSGTTANLYAVWGFSSSDVYAAGDQGTILHYNGTSWSAMSSGITAGLSDIWGSSSSNVFAVSDNGVVLEYDGSGWSTAAVAPSSSLNGIWGFSASEIYVVGSGGLVMRYDGTAAATSTTTTTPGANTSPNAVFAVSPLSGDTSTAFYVDAGFSNDVEDSTAVLQVRWDWEGDGGWDTSYTTAKTDAHTFGTAGMYTIVLEVKDSGGLTSIATELVEVLASGGGNTAPAASFVINPVVGDTSTMFILEPFACGDAEDPLADLTVRIDWESDGSWDDSIAADVDIAHQYAADGTYTITIEVEDTGGLTDQATQQVKVIAPVPGNTPPGAFFSVSPASGDTATSFSFDAAGCTDAEDGAGSLEVIWDFDGDGMWDTPFSPTKTATWQYAAGGTYDVILQVVDTGGLTDFVTGQVVVTGSSTTTSTTPGGNTAPTAVVLVHPPEGDTDTEFEFMAFDSSDAEDPVELLEVRWDFESDGLWDTGFSLEKTVVHRYEQPDLYRCTLEVLDTGGLTGQASIEVMVAEAGAGRCPLKRLLADDEEQLELLRRFRDEVLVKSRTGRFLVGLYYRSTGSIAVLLDQNPKLAAAARRLIRALLPVLAQVLSG